MSDQPTALRLADELLDGMSDEFWNQLNADAAAELRRLHAENEALGQFVIEVGGFWGNTKSVLTGPESLATAINDGFDALRRSEALNAELVEALRRLLIGYEHVSELARLWEPDYSSGSDRAGWVRGNDAASVARAALAKVEASNGS